MVSAARPRATSGQRRWLLGKPYKTQLAALPETYAAALKVDISPLVDVVTSAIERPLVAVGSGGSLSAAQFAVTLHERFAGQFAKAFTPLEIVHFGQTFAQTFAESACILLSAGGRNSDILSAFKHLVVREPFRLLAATACRGSSLSHLARQYRCANLLEVPVPSGKDGFLATNSLFAFVTVLARAYSQVFLRDSPLPSRFNGLLNGEKTISSFLDRLRRECEPLWKREVLVVLFSPSLQAAAFDVESKFTEAALGTVQLADYRHFAHGRHHWLAKRGASSSVLALVADEDRRLAEKTLSLIPSNIPKVRLDFSGSILTSSLASLLTAICVAGVAGEARGIDPGRPGVPVFGRQIYNLRIPAERLPQPRKRLLSQRAMSAIVRKSAFLVGCDQNVSVFEFWLEHYRTFCRRLEATKFRAVVFDYDGTICDERNRFTCPDPDVAGEIVRLLAKDISVGIATGRGDSVRKALRECVPSALQSKLLIGYYNGAELGLLDDDRCPEGGEPVGDLAIVSQALRDDKRLAALAQLSARRYQISVRVKAPVPLEAIGAIVQDCLESIGTPNLRIVISTHSLDILAVGVSKLAVVSALRKRHEWTDTEPVLCIGDRGRWPGNDHALLALPFSLSVAEVSTVPETCWNLAPAGHCGTQALLDYCYALDVRKGSFQFRVGRVGRRHS